MCREVVFADLFMFNTCTVLLGFIVEKNILYLSSERGYMLILSLYF